MPGNVIYLDHAATTPVLPEVRQAMMPYLEGEFGNPSSPHQAGRSVRAAVDQARKQLAGALGVEAHWVWFTSGGTEADNLAVLGRALAARAAGAPFRVAVSTIEHKAVLGAAHAVERLGGEVLELPVDATGLLDLDALESVLRHGVAVVSVMWVNNEVGVIQDVPAIAERCAAAGVPLHTDAVQAFGKIAVDLGALPGVMASLSAHKIGGPKGVGALILRDGGQVEPLIHGGGQQAGVRPGTENVAGIIGFGRAAELASEQREARAAAAGRLRASFERGVQDTVPDATVHALRAPRAPHIANVTLPGTDSEAMLMHLDLAGICCSSGSACTTGSVEPSHVLTAMGLPTDLAVASLRFSFGHGNTSAEVDTVLAKLSGIVAKVRRLAAVLKR